MLNHLIRLSLKHRLGVIITAALVMGWSVYIAKDLPIDVLPDLTKPTVTILTEAPGYSPEEVESRISLPLEYALMGVSGVSRLRSINDISLSLIYVEFDWGTDIYRARQLIQERLVGAELPAEIKPYMTPVTSLMGTFMLLTMVSPTEQISPMDLRTEADWTVTPRLRSIPGVSEVISMGGGLRQIQIQPHLEKLLSFGIALDELKTAVKEAVSNTTGGYLDQNSQEMMVRNLGMSTDFDDIARTMIKKEGDRPIRISDVADVSWGIEPMRGDAGGGHRDSERHETKGFPGVIISIAKAPGFDTIKLTHEVEERIKTLRSTLGNDIEIYPIYRQAEYINLSIGNLEKAVLEGAVIVAIVLFFFLMNLRVTLITLTAIPMSLGITFIIFHLMGLSVNSMTLGGLAVAIGMVVDDAIVDVENVFRRLRENASLESPLPTLEVIAKASAEVRSSILYTTILIVLVFIPLMALHGLEGRLFQPIAIATIVSITASTLVSLSLIPALASYLLRIKKGKEKPETKWVLGLKWLFEKTWLRLSLSQPIFLIAFSLGLLVWSWSLANRMAGNFLPSFREPTILVATTTPPGTSLGETQRMALGAQDLLLNIEGISKVGFQVGRAEKSDHVVPVSTVEFNIVFDEELPRPRLDIIEDIRETMSAIPGTFSAISTPMGDRIGHMLSGVSAKIAVKVFGRDLEQMRKIGEEIVAIARGIPGLEEARGEQQASIPQLRIEVDRDRASAYGITPGSINEQVSTLLGGENMGEVFEGERVYDLVIRLNKKHKQNPDAIKKLLVSTSTGQHIPLSYVADVRQATGPNTILRENTLRRFVVSINPTSANLNQLAERLEAEVKENVVLPAGMSLSFEGEYEAQLKAKKIIFWASLAIIIVITFLLLGYFKSLAMVLLVFTMIPLSTVGGVIFTDLTVSNISIATLVGFIAVSGIAARNNIMLLSHYLHLMRQEGMDFGLELVMRGTRERLVPVLSTAISAALALIPIYLTLDEPGQELLGPIAVVIIGGLISSTLLGLGLTPTLFYHFCRGSAAHAVKRLAPASE
jgi:CzcA family heavy metal efflux pump